VTDVVQDVVMEDRVEIASVNVVVKETARSTNCDIQLPNVSDCFHRRGSAGVEEDE
jgi:hypothetical protein